MSAIRSKTYIIVLQDVLFSMQDGVSDPLTLTCTVNLVLFSLK